MQNNGIFYLNGANNQIVMCVDQVKLILPIAIAIIAGLTEILLFFMLAIFLCCKTPSNVSKICLIHELICFINTT